MKVRAKHNVNLNGVWHLGGEVFDVESLDGIREHAEEIGYVSEIFPPMEQKASGMEEAEPAAEERPEAPKRGRRRKIAE